MTKYIENGVLKNGMTIGKAKVISTNLLKKGHMVPCEAFTPTSITIHETDCPGIPATQFYLSVKNGQNDLNRKPQASFQLCVDAYTVRQIVNLYRTCWHAGCKEGNATSIGIEICQYENNRELQKQAYLNAAELVKILKSEITTVKKVKRHYDWTRKICPSYMITKKYSGLTWNWFLNQLNSKEKEATKTKYVRILQDINIHSKPDFDAANVIGKVTAGGAYTITEKVKRTGTDMYKLKSGVYITASPKYVEVFYK